jgi:nucleoside 2-deoxyribosyltransferase
VKLLSESHGIGAARVDEIEHSGKITELILEKIEKSRFLVCDLTAERPNVYYELGYAHGLKKDVILLESSETPVLYRGRTVPKD